MFYTMKLHQIIENKESLAASDEYPLLNNTYIEELAVSYTQNINNVSIEEISKKIGEYPKFKNITFSDIADLRVLVHFEISNNNIDNWLERILRYCEINYAKLKDNEKKYGRKREETVKLFNQIFALFIEYHMYKNDLLFINTALKINDLKWIVPKSKSFFSTKALRLIKLTQIHKILETLEHE